MFNTTIRQQIFLLLISKLQVNNPYPDWLYENPVDLLMHKLSSHLALALRHLVSMAPSQEYILLIPYLSRPSLIDVCHVNLFIAS